MDVDCISHLEKRLAGLIKLKNIALKRNIPIPQEASLGLKELEVSRQNSGRLPETESSKLDLIEQTLTEATSPIGLQHVERMEDGPIAGSFSIIVLLIGVLMSIIAWYLISLARLPGNEHLHVLSATSLGIVGAILYVMLPSGRVNMYVGLDYESKMNCIARIVLGGILGAVIFLMKPEMFKLNDGKSSLELLYPLVGGYSITLVIGILGKVVIAVELALGINERKNVNILRRDAPR